MKVLITGAAGFLGVHVVRRLIAHGYTDIRCLLRDTSKADRLLQIARTHPEVRIELCCGNLRSKYECARAVSGVSLIFHLAAGLRGAAAELFADSVIATRNLLQAIQENSGLIDRIPRVVLISSFGVYGVAQLRRGAQIDEDSPVEIQPHLRDPYSHSKLRQEQLAWELQHNSSFELVVLRPGVIYGPGGGALSTRVGLQVGPLFFHLGGKNLLPLSFVENCADAIVVVGTHPDAAGRVFNIHDDDLPTASSYLRQYRKHVKRIRSIRLPYALTKTLAHGLEIYHRRSQGQLPAILTRYKVACSWGGNRFDNSRIRSLGWKQIVPTQEAMQRTFTSMRTDVR